jgi:hypothetical protein
LLTSVARSLIPDVEIKRSDRVREGGGRRVAPVVDGEIFLWI